MIAIELIEKAENGEDVHKLLNNITDSYLSSDISRAVGYARACGSLQAHLEFILAELIRLKKQTNG